MEVSLEGALEGTLKGAKRAILALGTIVLRSVICRLDRHDFGETLKGTQRTILNRATFLIGIHDGVLVPEGLLDGELKVSLFRLGI